MNVTILTLFPEMFSGPFDSSIIKRARDQKILTIRTVNIRDFATNAYKSVDDHPYGGGLGMVLRVDVVDRALTTICKNFPTGTTRSILLDPQGTPFTQSKAKSLSRFDHLIFICGHYEGVDERIRDLVDEEISIGDYVLTGGEIPTMVMVDSVARLIPGVLRQRETTENESFSGDAGHLEYPQYTRPEEYKGKKVPAVLLSGNHQNIASWRTQESLRRTRIRRPDLIRPKKR